MRAEFNTFLDQKSLACKFFISTIHTLNLPLHCTYSKLSCSMEVNKEEFLLDRVLWPLSSKAIQRSEAFWPTALMPNLLAIRQSKNFFNFGQYKVFLDYIFHVLHIKVAFKDRKAKKLLYNFVYVSRAITSTLMAVVQNETYQQIVNSLFQFV